jgi:hypothetical protein
MTVQIHRRKPPMVPSPMWIFLRPFPFLASQKTRLSSTYIQSSNVANCHCLLTVYLYSFIAVSKLSTWEMDHDNDRYNHWWLASRWGFRVWFMQWKGDNHIPQVYHHYQRRSDEMYRMLWTQKLAIPKKERAISHDTSCHLTMSENKIKIFFKVSESWLRQN